MKRLLSAALTVAGLGLAAGSASAQYVAAPPSVVRYVQSPSYTPGTYYYSNGYYYGTPYRTTGGTYSYHNGVLRGPSGAMTGRPSVNFDPTGRGVQLYKPWLAPIR
jgi:hypothetical protein